MMLRTDPSTYNLRISTADCMLFPVSGVQLKFFRAKTRPENAAGMLGTEVGVLFRLKGDDDHGTND
jgi:hypothetical protein